MPDNINFKRKKDGKDGNWGVGLDYLLKDYWDDLDKITENNYYGRHNVKLINFVFPKVSLALKKFVSDTKKNNDLVDKARVIQRFGVSAKSVDEKVIFMDTTTQFLREIYTGKKAPLKKRIIRKHYRYNRLKTKKIRGVVASSRFKKIKGIVRVIFNEKYFSKFRKGEILVTDETDAIFLPIMRKAKGIVTDEGGILCHAAIISRELKIPCIVNTRKATKILKNGDLVEMNIKNGEIRILKKARN